MTKRKGLWLTRWSIDKLIQVREVDHQQTMETLGSNQLLISIRIMGLKFHKEYSLVNLITFKTTVVLSKTTTWSSSNKCKNNNICNSSSSSSNNNSTQECSSINREDLCQLVEEETSLVANQVWWVTQSLAKVAFHKQVVKPSTRSRGRSWEERWYLDRNSKLIPLKTIL